MRLKLYIFTKRRAVVEVDGPTKALAWAAVKKIFREIEAHEAELAEVGAPPRVYDIPPRTMVRDLAGLIGAARELREEES